VKSISVPIVGIVAAAALDNRLSWGTVASVLVALYCHRLYRRRPASVGACTCSPADELRPGWAARWALVDGDRAQLSRSEGG
jgi:hypothetical protein